MAKQNILKPEDATRIVANLRSLNRKIESFTSEHFVETYGDGHWTPLPDININDPPHASLAEAIQRLDRALAEVGFNLSPSEELNLEEFWTVGSVPFTAPIRSIRHGFLQPILRVPILRHVPNRVVRSLLKFPKIGTCCSGSITVTSDGTITTLTTRSGVLTSSFVGTLSPHTMLL
jgi:hypothetical protein